MPIQNLISIINQLQIIMNYLHTPVCVCFLWKIKTVTIEYIFQPKPSICHLYQLSPSHTLKVHLTAMNMQ